jgi:hypothetical protein
VPRKGEIVVFNRSHYEDVLVPVVKGWIGKDETEQRYAHLRDFERMLVETGTVIVKCLLHISKDEQRQRLQERLDDPTKRWKFELGDIETRKQWDDYQRAYAAALQATAAPSAPWVVVPANSKMHRNDGRHLGARHWRGWTRAIEGRFRSQAIRDRLSMRMDSLTHLVPAPPSAWLSWAGARLCGRRRLAPSATRCPT